MDNNEKKICKRCVLPETPPHITIDDEGICNICREYERANPDGIVPQEMLESNLVKILNKNKGKEDYDALVMCSGGKDSTAALYYAVKRYKLRVLAFTFDHGFETDEALDNVKRAVGKLGIDWLYYKSDYMKEMFSYIIKNNSKASICHLCSMWYVMTTLKMAARYNIPIVMAGWTVGQAKLPTLITKHSCDIGAKEYAEISQATKEFLKDNLSELPKYKDFPRSMEEVLKRANKKHKTMIISPHWFLRDSIDEYVELITNELGWKKTELSYPKNSTNCMMNFMSSELSNKYYGYNHYHVEMSKLIRMNRMTRDEALRLLKKNYDNKILDEILRRLNLK